MRRILLKNGKIFDGERFFCGSVLTEGEKIAAIGEVEAPADALVIHASGCIVCPGLVDIHTHLSEMSGEPFGFPAALATIPFGVTAAVEACAVLSAEKSADLPLKTGALVPLSLKDGAIDYPTMEKRLADFGARTLGVKIYFDTAQASLCTVEQIAEISAYAKHRGLFTMVHCTNAPVPMTELVSALNEGDIITHAYHGAPHTIAEDDFAAYKLAKAKGIYIDLGMAGEVHADLSVLKKAIDKGYLPDVISTDITQFSAYIRGGIYGLPMCMSICRALGMKEIDLFRAVTSSAAKAVKREGEWGRLAVGSAADIAVLSFGDIEVDMKDRWGNGLKLHEGYKNHVTILNGQILYRSGI